MTTIKRILRQLKRFLFGYCIALALLTSLAASWMPDTYNGEFWDVKKTQTLTDRYWSDFTASKLPIVKYIKKVSKTEPQAALWFLTTGGKNGFASRAATPEEKKDLLATIDVLGEFCADKQTIVIGGVDKSFDLHDVGRDYLRRIANKSVERIKGDYDLLNKWSEWYFTKSNPKSNPICSFECLNNLYCHNSFGDPSRYSYEKYFMNLIVNDIYDNTNFLFDKTTSLSWLMRKKDKDMLLKCRQSRSDYQKINYVVSDKDPVLASWYKKFVSSYYGDFLEEEKISSKRNKIAEKINFNSRAAQTTPIINPIKMNKPVIQMDKLLDKPIVFDKHAEIKKDIIIPSSEKELCEPYYETYLRNAKQNIPVWNSASEYYNYWDYGIIPQNSVKYVTTAFRNANEPSEYRSCYQNYMDYVAKRDNPRNEWGKDRDRPKRQPFSRFRH